MHEGRRIPGEPGIWVLVFFDLMVFAALLLNYALSEIGSPRAWSQGLGEFDRSLGFTNTLILLTSSWLVVLATIAIRKGATAPARRLILAALALGIAFIGIKAFEYHDKFAHGISPMTNTYYNFYFSITGLHLFHIVVGCGVLLWMRTRTQSAAAEPQYRAVECGAIFWHMVDLLWIVIFPLLYLL